jgi:hypothetical protein
MKDVFERSEVQDILRDTFYAKKRRAKQKPHPKPDHYDVICISLYKDDLARLDRAVAALKKAGHRKMSRSALIRYALDTMDVTKLPRSY